ncbi:hypothetical protein RB195_026027 [Necator americanus]|uniref:Uncharacterized protein n=1 Tax=Necator americanus TaxID=51031 RepID=A0ABR1EV69_NECAM
MYPYFFLNEWQQYSPILAHMVFEEDYSGNIENVVSNIRKVLSGKVLPDAESLAMEMTHPIVSPVIGAWLYDVQRIGLILVTSLLLYLRCRAQCHFNVKIVALDVTRKNES